MGYRQFDTPVGPLVAETTATGLLRITLASAKDLNDHRALSQDNHWLDALGNELSTYFLGQLRTFTIPIDWSLSRGVHLTILRALLESVPYGQTISYGRLAADIGKPGAARLVGQAMATNPIPIVVPCHRVISSDGSLGGYSLGGIETKRMLLNLENRLV